MKTFFIAILVAFIAIDCTVGYHGPLKSAKSSNSVAWTDACDECQTIIKRIVEVAKDPTKVAELKLLLSELCRETSYVEECKLFVSKLDLFLERLLPFLSDAHHVCQELHICRNRKLKQFHRVGRLFTSKFLNKKEAKESLLCEECQFAAQELLTLVDNPTIQQKVQDWLEEEVCEHMGRFKDTCNEYVEVVLPDFWQEMHTILADQKQFCVDLELCPPSLVDDDERDSIRTEKISGKLIEMMKENEN